MGVQGTGFGSSGVNIGNDVRFFSGSGAPSALTGLNEAGKGSIYFDYTNGQMYRNTGTITAPVWRSFAAQEGGPSYNTLRVAANVANAETVVINGITFTFKVVNTDSTKNTVAALADEAVTEFFTMTAHGLVAGDLLRVENEICAVDRVWDADRVRLRRGVSGTTQAAHLTNQDIYIEAVPGSVPNGCKVGLVTTLTPTAATAAFTADFNNANRQTALNARVYNVDANTLYFVTADRPGGNPIGATSTWAVSETLAGASNAWDAANFIAGTVPGGRTTIIRVPTAGEVAAGKLIIAFPFAPTVEDVVIRTVSTQAAVAWDGAATVSGNLVILDNAGLTDWAETSEVIVTARG